MLPAGFARWLAIALVLVMGLSGLAVGAELAIATAAARRQIEPAAVAIPAVLVVYGLALVIGAFGMVLGRTWAWWLAIGAVVGGLVLLFVLLLTVDIDDAVLLGGVVIWGITLAVLLVAGRDRRLRGR